jgi:hypothetical protein
MLTDGLQLLGASTATNFTIESGGSLPTTGTHTGELYFQTGVGLHVFTDTGWTPVGSTTSASVASALGYTPAALDSNGKVLVSQIPPISIISTSVVASETAMLALTAQRGDVAIRTDLSESFILSGTDPTVLSDWQQLLSPLAAVRTVNSFTGDVNLTTTNIAEGNNQYFTQARARASISVSGGATYNSATGVLTVQPGGVTTVAGRSGDIVLTSADVAGVAALAAPAFTGFPTSTTPSTADSSTVIATTAFVKAQGYITAAQAPAAPVQSVAGRTGAVVLTSADISGVAVLASPAFTGVPVAPTATLTDSSTQLATTAFVKGQNYLTSVSAPVSSFNTRTGAITLTSADVTTALSFTPVNATVVGAANGIATLDGTGKLTTAQVPTSLIGGLNYQGTWNPATNTPSLTSGTGTKGYYYKVSVASNVSTLDGISQFNVGDIVAFNGATWDKIDGLASEVTSVAGRTGAITLAVADVSGAAGLAAPAFTGFPTSTTPSINDSSTVIATTAFVKAQNYISTGGAPVQSVAGKTGAVTLVTADVAESTNLYYTQARFDSAFTAKSTTNLAEGTNLYFTTARAAAAAPVQSVAGRTGAVVLTSADVSGVATSGANSNITSLTGLTTPLSVAQGGTGVATSTGTGSVVLSASPTLTGVPTAPTAAVADNSNTIATTGFVKSLGYASATTSVASFNTRTGAVTLTSADVTGALTYTPVNTIALGQSNGVATLDSTGKLTLAQIPASLVGAVVYQGTWDASTNTPSILSGQGVKGVYYKVNVAGTTAVDGITQWNIGDTIIFDGTTWDKIDGIASEVITVAGKSGTVTLNTTDVAESSNLYFTTARAAAAAPVQSVAGRTGTITLAVADVTGAAGLAAPAFTGFPTSTTPSTADSSTVIATTAFVKAQGYAQSSSSVSSFNLRTGIVTLTSSDVTTALTYTPVNKAGDTLTGFLTLNAIPTAALHAATKSYVDSAVAVIDGGSY